MVDFLEEHHTKKLVILFKCRHTAQETRLPFFYVALILKIKNQTHAAIFGAANVVEGHIIWLTRIR